MMLNRAPIFVIGFQRGETNILTNLLASHPDTRFHGRETHMVFCGDAREPVNKWFRRLWYLPLMLGERGTSSDLPRSQSAAGCPGR